MCIPPNDKKCLNYFEEMRVIAEKFKTKEISMGMSGDYMEALKCGATFLRIGSKIFGERN